MTNIIETIEKLPNLLPLKSASDDAITKAENDLKLSFSEEYKEYLARFGAIIADGIEMTGIAKSEYRNVVNVTLQGWKLNKNVPKNLYVVEDTRVDGIIIWQDSNGLIYKSLPNSEIEKINDSLVEYLNTKR